MDPTILAAILAILGVVIGALLGHSLTLEQLRKEQREILRTEYFKKQLEAYQKFWTLLFSAAYFPTDEKSIIIREGGKIYLNVDATNKFVSDFRDFMYSEYGLFLSTHVRDAVYKVRKFLLELIPSDKPANTNLLDISNTKAKKVENAFDWIRRRTREDVGLLDIRVSTDELDLK